MKASKPLKLFIEASPLAELRTGGIPHFTSELVRGLTNHPEHGTTFQVVLVITADKRSRLNRWHYSGIKYRVLPVPLRIFNLVWKYNLLPPLDIFLGKGVYVFPNYKNWPLARSASMTYIHDLSFVRYPAYAHPKNLVFLNANIQRWLKRATVVLTGSEHAKQEITELLHVPTRKIISIYHGVDHAQYYPRKQAEIRGAKDKYDIPEQYVLYLSNLEPRKNLARLITAYKELPAAVRDHYSLVIVGGGGWQNQDILAAISAAQKQGYHLVRPAQYVEDTDLPALLSGAALLAHPALYEGFGLAPLQAMACGTPVLTANNSSLPEVVADAAVLVDAEDERDISAKMSRVLTDKVLSKSLADKGIKQAAKFSWDIAAENLLQEAKRVGR